MSIQAVIVSLTFSTWTYEREQKNVSFKKIRGQGKGRKKPKQDFSNEAILPTLLQPGAVTLRQWIACPQPYPLHRGSEPPPLNAKPLLRLITITLRKKLQCTRSLLFAPLMTFSYETWWQCFLQEIQARPIISHQRFTIFRSYQATSFICFFLVALLTS